MSVTGSGGLPLEWRGHAGLREHVFEFVIFAGSHDGDDACFEFVEPVGDLGEDGLRVGCSST